MSASYIDRSDPENPIAIIFVDGQPYEHTIAHVVESKQEWLLGVLHNQMNAIHHRAVIKTIFKIEDSKLSDIPDVIRLEENKMEKLHKDNKSFNTDFSTVKWMVAPTQR